MHHKKMAFVAELSNFAKLSQNVKRKYLILPITFPEFQFLYIVFRVVTSIYLHVSLDEIVFCLVTKNKAEIDELLGQTIIRSLSTIV